MEEIDIGRKDGENQTWVPAPTMEKERKNPEKPFYYNIVQPASHPPRDTQKGEPACQYSAWILLYWWNELPFHLLIKVQECHEMDYDGTRWYMMVIMINTWNKWNKDDGINDNDTAKIYKWTNKYIDYINIIYLTLFVPFFLHL